MIVKSHKRENKILLSVCDDDLLGKKFTEGEKQLDLTSEFYAGEQVTKTEASDLMRNVDYLNIVGKKSVQLAIDEELIEEENVIFIDGIPSAQAVILRD